MSMGTGMEERPRPEMMIIFNGGSGLRATAAILTET